MEELEGASGSGTLEQDEVLLASMKAAGVGALSQRQRRRHACVVYRCGPLLGVSALHAAPLLLWTSWRRPGPFFCPLPTSHFMRHACRTACSQV